MSIYAVASVNDAAIRVQISILKAKSGAAWRLNWLPESACRKPESVGRKDPYWGYRWGYFWGYRIRYHLGLGIYVASVDPSSATIFNVHMRSHGAACIRERWRNRQKTVHSGCAACLRVSGCFRSVPCAASRGVGVFWGYFLEGAKLPCNLATIHGPHDE